MDYVITDGHGYWAGRRKGLDFWSSLISDAAKIHFREAAEIIGKSLPMPVKIKAIKTPN